MNFEKSGKWEPVENPDYSKRKPEEWAKIYGVKLIEKINGLWSEYEWAYNYDKLKLIPNLKDKNGEYNFEEISNKEMRALELKRDIFMGANIGEKEILINKYIETEWIRNHSLI